MDDFALPSLAPHLKLTRGPDAKGEPSWTLHNPVANTYYKLDWVSFECLARFPLHRTAQSLKNSVESETTLTISLEQIADVFSFLQKNALLSLNDQAVQYKSAAGRPLWKRMLHGYLYITIPLFKPQVFLEKIYPRISFLFSRAFLTSMMVFLAVMLVVTLPRLDEFLHTFTNLVSLEGAIAALLVFAFVKIVHEFAHAFTAIRYGVNIPHMGVAFIVMYPVLYTETTGSWQLSSRRARFHIGMAGIMAELCLAALFLALWNISPPGSAAQTASFLVVAISLVSSLLVNLNPLMRFDGYYMFSDATGFDNLQTRSCNFARYALREWLFNLGEPLPEELPAADARFLTVFGFCLLIYRFFLFLGIALLVYHLFFQPLGFFLMMVELVWFIALPIWSELKIWYEKRTFILTRKRSAFPAMFVFFGLLVIFVPWKTTTSLPAVLHATGHQVLYPPVPAKIISLSVREGKDVKAGDVLAVLESPDLETKIRTARQQLSGLETLRRRGQSNPALLQDAALSEEAIQKVRLDVKTLEEQKNRLMIKAPFDGTLRDFNPELQTGRYIAATESLFTIVNPAAATVTAYADEATRDKISSGGVAIFVSDDRYVSLAPLSIDYVSQTGDTGLTWPELASLHGGPIAADHGAAGVIVPRRALYEVRATTDSPAPAQVERGFLKISSPPSSLFLNWIKELGAVFRREASLG